MNIATIKVVLGAAAVAGLAIGAAPAALGASSSPAASHPYWDGRNPSVWNSNTQPACTWRIAGRTGFWNYMGFDYNAICKDPSNNTFLWYRE